MSNYADEDDMFNTLFNDLIYDGLDQEDNKEKSLNAFEEYSKLYEEYFNSENFSDLILNVNGTQNYHAHKMILVMTSEVFKTMLCDPNWKRDDKIIELNETSSSEKIFDK